MEEKGFKTQYREGGGLEPVPTRKPRTTPTQKRDTPYTPNIQQPSEESPYGQIKQPKSQKKQVPLDVLVPDESAGYLENPLTYAEPLEVPDRFKLKPESKQFKFNLTNWLYNLAPTPVQLLKGEPNKPAQFYAGVVGSVESYWNPEVANVSGTMTQDLFNRGVNLGGVVSTQKVFVGKGATQRLAETKGVAYVGGSLAGELLQGYVTGKAIEKMASSPQTDIFKANVRQGYSETVETLGRAKTKLKYKIADTDFAERLGYMYYDTKNYLSPTRTKISSKLDDFSRAVKHYSGLDYIVDQYQEAKYGIKLKVWNINTRPPVEYARYTGPQLVSDMDYFIYRDLMKTSRTPAQYKASTELGYYTKRTMDELFESVVAKPNVSSAIGKTVTKASKGGGVIVKSGKQALILETKQVTKQIPKYALKSFLVGTVVSQTAKTVIPKPKVKQTQKTVQKQTVKVEPVQTITQIQKQKQFMISIQSLKQIPIQKPKQQQKQVPVIVPKPIQVNVPKILQKQEPKPYVIQEPKQKQPVIQLQKQGQPQPQIYKLAQPQPQIFKQQQKLAQPQLLKTPQKQKPYVPQLSRPKFKKKKKDELFGGWRLKTHPVPTIKEMSGISPITLGRKKKNKVSLL